MHEKFVCYRRTLKKLIRKARKSYTCAQLAEKAGDKKATWRILNTLLGKLHKGIKPEFKVDDIKITNRRLISNQFNIYFNSIASKMNSDCIGLLKLESIPDFTEYLPKPCQSNIFLESCSAEELRTIIAELPNGKASDIPVTLIKFAAPIIIPHLQRLYTESMNDGVFPSELKLGRIGPVYKMKGDKQLMENYRPVSILPIFGKIFEKVIYNRLHSFLEKHNIINENQYGFRKAHSTSHALNYSVSYIEHNLKRKLHVLGVFVDLSKAFDTIDHSILLNKLQNYGIRGVAHKLIASYLSDRHQYVKVLEEDSETLPVIYGVPQGSVLGPLLFLLYINDICKTTDIGKFILFADDTNLFVTGVTKKEAFHKGNQVLELINNYMFINKLHINLGKCCYLYFSPHKTRQKRTETSSSLDNNEDEDNDHVLLLNKEPIKQQHETKFLGVVIDDSLTWESHIDKLVSKLSSCTGRLSRIKQCLPEELLDVIYRTLFESHLTYGITIWGCVSIAKLDRIFKVQKKCIRILFGDSEGYKNKFKTCARTRPIDKQILGSEFYCLEHTKPLFNKHKFLTIHNLFTYHTCITLYKILRTRVPIALYSMFSFSSHIETRLKSQLTGCVFVDNSTIIWNNIREKLSVNDFNISISVLKSNVKSYLLRKQQEYDQLEWCILNYT